MIEPKKYLEEITEFCNNNSISLIEGIIHYCERHNLEVEYIASLVKKDSIMKAKLSLEAQKLNIIKREVQLPFEE